MTQDLALPDDYMTGLEDFTPSASMPRINIKHAEGVFVDSLTNEEFPLIYGIPLGLVKQRVMWHPKVEDGDRPQCKSNDGETGYPNIKGPTQKCMFPAQRVGIDLATLPKDEFDRPTLRCEGCRFTEWTKDPEDPSKRVPPACSERYTIPILYSTTEGGEPDRAGIVSFQRSGVKPTRDYIQGFARSKQPLFVSFVLITLELGKRGSVIYSTPKFKRMGATDKAKFQEYVDQYREVRELLRMPPRPSDEERDTAGGVNQPLPEGEVIQAVVVTPVQQPAATPAPASRGAQSIVDAASTVIAAPPAPVTVPAQPAPAQPVQPAWAAGADDDDLPF